MNLSITFWLTVLFRTNIVLMRSVSVNELILHGYNTLPGEWPWHVAIYKKNESSEHYACGGTIINKLYVLTAAHCVKDDKKDIFIRLGVHNLKSTSGEIQNRTIRKIHRAGNFTRFKGLRNDLAILQLNEAIVVDKHVDVAKVSLTKDLTGKLGTVIGWGNDERDRIPSKLKSVKLLVVDVYTCLKSDPVLFGSTLDKGIFCAGYTNGTSACNGDSGGGIFFEENGAWHLGGIVSYSRLRRDGSGLCSQKSYGAFTKIRTYLEWIDNVARLNLSIISNIAQRQAGVSNICQGQNIAPVRQDLRDSTAPSWVKWNLRQPFPSDAVFAGSYIIHHGYVGRVRYNGAHAVVKVYPTLKLAHFPYGDEEISISSCEVLTGSGFSWVSAHNGNVPANALTCGTDANCEPLYIGRANHNGSLTPGTINSALGGLFLPYEWAVHKYVDYEVLVL